MLRSSQFSSFAVCRVFPVAFNDVDLEGASILGHFDDVESVASHRLAQVCEELYPAGTGTA